MSVAANSVVTKLLRWFIRYRATVIVTQTSQKFLQVPKLTSHLYIGNVFLQRLTTTLLHSFGISYFPSYFRYQVDYIKSSSSFVLLEWSEVEFILEDRSVRWLLRTLALTNFLYYTFLAIALLHHSLCNHVSSFCAPSSS